MVVNHTLYMATPTDLTYIHWKPRVREGEGGRGDGGEGGGGRTTQRGTPSRPCRLLIYSQQGRVALHLSLSQLELKAVESRTTAVAIESIHKTHTLLYYHIPKTQANKSMLHAGESTGTPTCSVLPQYTHTKSIGSFIRVDRNKGLAASPPCRPVPSRPPKMRHFYIIPRYFIIVYSTSRTSDANRHSQTPPATPNKHTHTHI